MIHRRVSSRTAAGSPSVAVGHFGVHPVAAFNFALLIRCERERSSVVFPPSAASKRGIERGGFAPMDAASEPTHSRLVTGASSHTL